MKKRFMIKHDYVFYDVPLGIWIWYYKEILRLKIRRVLRFGKRTIVKNFASFLFTLVLLVGFLIIAVAGDIALGLENNIFSALCNYKNMIFTTLIVTFSINIVNTEKEWHRKLIRQYEIYREISFEAEYYIKDMEELLYDENAIENIEQKLYFIDMTFLTYLQNMINFISPEHVVGYNERLLRFMYIDLMKNIKKQIALYQSGTADKLNLISMLNYNKQLIDEYILPGLRRPWRWDINRHEKIINKLSEYKREF